MSTGPIQNTYKVIIVPKNVVATNQSEIFLSNLGPIVAFAYTAVKDVQWPNTQHATGFACSGGIPLNHLLILKFVDSPSSGRSLQLKKNKSEFPCDHLFNDSNIAPTYGQVCRI